MAFQLGWRVPPPTPLLYEDNRRVRKLAEKVMDLDPGYVYGPYPEPWNP